ncbi:MAG: AAA family ATPase [Lachnospiraceae bacterium]|nr:AAA family ATPase [Lachnospiraceae bacterium]
MIIVELYGTPGCGKTTLYQQVIGKLNAKPYVLANHQLMVDFQLDNFPRRFGVPRILKEYKHYLLFLSILLSLISYGISKERIKFTKVLFVFCYRLLKLGQARKYDVIFFEEGLCQMISSIAHDQKIKNNFIDKMLMKQIKKAFPAVKLIELNITAEENIKRLRKRNREKSRFDRVPDDHDLAKLLKTKQDNLNQIAKAIADKAGLSLDMAADSEINSDLLAGFIADFFPAG